MQNEALKNAGHSSFFIFSFSEFINLAEMTMQDISLFIAKLFSAASAMKYDENKLHNNIDLNKIVQASCYFSTIECLKNMAKLCIKKINPLNQELSETKRNKKKFNQKEIEFIPIDKQTNENDCVYDMLNQIYNDYYDEKYKNINLDDYQEEYKGILTFDEIEKELKDSYGYEEQMNYVRLLAKLISNAHYALTLLEESYDIPF